MEQEQWTVELTKAWIIKYYRRGCKVQAQYEPDVFWDAGPYRTREEVERRFKTLHREHKTLSSQFTIKIYECEIEILPCGRVIIDREDLAMYFIPVNQKCEIPDHIPDEKYNEY